ncbi:MAG: ADP-glyceromanno-heptose 6-epimerase [Cytophagales bacterium]|nr:ADP-glyceromanno-heptose 6-epimerase [Cytophagales bacterium]
MIVVTGAAGFIASNLVDKLNQENFNNLIVVDKFDDPEKNKNLDGCSFTEKVDRNNFFDWLDTNYEEVEFIFHLGARTDTTEFDRELLWELNTNYTKEIWKRCISYQIPLIYASSAATYGLGENGYLDDESKIDELKPLNPYGESKNEFDKWALAQEKKPFFWVGLKFFNVYGPKENHKGRMASVVWHAFNQIQETDEMKLFRSHNPDYNDGEQMRDFVYVKDVGEVMYWLMHHREDSGIYNMGSGKARTFLDLTKAVFAAMNKKEQIGFIDTPLDIRDKYQYFTEADMGKLKGIGFEEGYRDLEKGVLEYVTKLAAST